MSHFFRHFGQRAVIVSRRAHSSDRPASTHLGCRRAAITRWHAATMLARNSSHGGAYGLLLSRAGPHYNAASGR